MLDPYIIVPKFSLEPNKLCLFNEVVKRQNTVLEPKKSNFKEKVQKVYPLQYEIDGSIILPPNVQDNIVLNMVPKNKPKVKKAFHNFRISENAFRTMKRRINWLYYLSKSRYKKTLSGKEIFNFKMSFITLTLPSKQQHNTAFITEKILNHFLTTIRQKYGMQNYVWRLEFQNNGNVHYHLVTDCYVDYFVLRSNWNRILDKYGYVQPYTDRFKNLSLTEYNQVVNRDKKIEFKKIADWYAKGCKYNWTDPNTVDVKSVTSGKKISFYIAKYFAKDPDNYCDKNELDTAENSESLRLWFCSRALSKLKTVSDYVDAVDFNVKFIIDEVAEVRTLVHRYCTVFYFTFKKEVHKWRTFLEQLLRDYSKKQGYIPAT